MASSGYFPYSNNSGGYSYQTPMWSPSQYATEGGGYDWDAFYASSKGKDPGYSGTGTGAGGFNFPTGEEVFPWSKSTTKSTSYGGLAGDYSNKILDLLYPMLQPAIENYIPNIDKYTNEAMGLYSQSMNNMLTEMLPDILGEYGNRGVLSSTVMSDALADTSTNLGRTALEKQYQTAMQAALMKAQLPNVLGELMGLGKVSTSEGGTESYEEDQTAMYRIIAQMFSTLMS